MSLDRVLAFPLLVAMLLSCTGYEAGIKPGTGQEEQDKPGKHNKAPGSARELPPFLENTLDLIPDLQV